ncbi:unnamed protein product, partial [Allacma fusca]
FIFINTMTLPANSTFLPVLDDLLSPDFRPVLLPAQTPQTPKDIVSFGGGKIITNAYGNITFNPGAVLKSELSRPTVVATSLKNSSDNKENIDVVDSTEAAKKIQNWWKSKRSCSFDINAERAKHSIQHNRTEDHIRYLESEVNRLKSALSSERKIRSLQLEAIRSLWNQMQRISTANSDTSIMTRSVPNGLPKESAESASMMSMSLTTALETLPESKEVPEPPHSSCSCSKEVENLKEVFTQEISQLRTMIHQLTAAKEPEEESVDAVVASKQKRPLSLNIVGISNLGDHTGT